MSDSSLSKLASGDEEKNRMKNREARNGSQTR
jgi:hypothetical protein